MYYVKMKIANKGALRHNNDSRENEFWNERTILLNFIQENIILITMESIFYFQIL